MTNGPSRCSREITWRSSSLGTAETMILKPQVTWANEARQPTPGERLVCNGAPMARRGCADRYTALAKRGAAEQEGSGARSGAP
jgi:hypothetical protein